MKIKTRFSITIFLFGLIIACVLIFLAIMDNHVKKSGEQDELAKNISQGAMELNYLANDYLIHREDRQIERWRASFARFSARMANLKPETANEKQLVKHMVADVRQLELTFDDVLTGIQHFPNNQSDGYLFSELFSVSSSRLAVQTQGLFSDSQRLNGLIRSRLDRLANIRTFLVYAILFLFAIFLLANYTFTYRRIMRSVALLRAGMKIIGAGDLDFKMKKEWDDELGEVAEAVNQTTAELKKVTASQADLQKEIYDRKHAEEALRESEKKYRRIVEMANEGIWEVDAERKTTYMNRRMAEMLGYSLDDAIKKSWMDFTDSEGVALSNRNVEKRRRGEPDSYEYKLIRGDGTPLWVHVNAAPIHGVDGTYESSLSMLTDITERKLAEERLRRSEIRWNTAIESFAEGAIIATEDEQVIYWNPAARAMHGISGPDEFIEPLENTPLTFELWTRDGSHKLDLDEWPMRRIKRGESLRNLELRIRRPDQGWEKIFSYSGTMVDTAAGERLIFLTCHDLTELRRAEAALRENREDLDRAQAVGQIGWWRHNTRKNVLTWSAENHRIFGVPEGTPLSYEFFLSMVHPDDRQNVDMQWQAGLRGEPYDFEHRIVVDNKTKWVREKAYLEFDTSGQLLGGFGITQDITTRKQAEEDLRLRTEELAATNKELESFSYSVSHDLRAPLRSIKGFSSILLEDYSGKLDEDAANLLTRIATSTDRMAAIINDMLSLAKISRESTHCQEIDLRSIANSVVNELRNTGPERNVEINIAHELPAFADARLMGIALSNLIGNAWKYSSKNPSARIDIGLMSKEKENIFFVRDNGAGFDMTLAHKLFQPFQRLHPASEFPGTGIGLAIVHRIIGRHGGRIWAESDIEKGSTFYFTLAGLGGGGRRR